MYDYPVIFVEFKFFVGVILQGIFVRDLNLFGKLFLRGEGSVSRQITSSAALVIPCNW